jgi:hypothetical protein
MPMRTSVVVAKKNGDARTCHGARAHIRDRQSRAHNREEKSRGKHDWGALRVGGLYLMLG